MAIVFEQPVNESRLRLAYNNDVLRFHSNSVAGSPMYADILVWYNTLRIYPAPDGKFYFNFKPYVSAFINTNNFADTVQTDLQTTDPETFVYRGDDGTLLRSDVVVKIYLDDEAATVEQQSFELAWLAGVEQLGDFNELNKTKLYVMSPFAKATANRWYIKYWQGYPFDISVYLEEGRSLTLTNQTNGLYQNFDSMPGYVNRLFFSDGRTDETIEDLVPFLQGYNDLKITHSLAEGEAADDKFISLDKVPYTCGVYLKWLNKYGGYSYWLFENTSTIDRATKSQGDFYTDNENLSNTFNRSINLGQTTQDTLRVVAELLNEDERRIVEGILDSPKIYLFTGQPFAQNDYREWIEITLKSNSARVKNPKEALTNMALDFELPQRYTQTL